MELRPWQTIEGTREVLHENAWFSVYREKCILPSGKEGMYHVVQSEPSVMVIPILPNGKIRMVKQYRYISREESIEFPSGNTRHGSERDQPEEAAARELAEEANLSGALTCLGSFLPWNGAGSERCWAFIAEHCEETVTAADETEEFIFLDLAKEEIETLIKEGKITDGESLASWTLYKSYANLQ